MDIIPTISIPPTQPTIPLTPQDFKIPTISVTESVVDSSIDQGTNITNVEDLNVSSVALTSWSVAELHGLLGEE